MHIIRYKGVVLVHLGTPRDFSESSARDFLKEFLGDPNVISAPYLTRLILASRIAAKRGAKFAENLRKFAVGGEMQMNYYSSQIAAKLQERINVPVRVAGIYGDMNVRKVSTKLSEEVGGDVLFIPLFPQYSSATVKPVQKKIRENGFLASQIVDPYCRNSAYIDALAQSVRDAGGDKTELLLVSFHSMPESSDNLRAYVRDCEDTRVLLAGRLGLFEDKTKLAWQSAMKRGVWMSPKISNMVEALAKDGVESISVVSPGFYCDCLETSLELECDLKKTFLESGGKSFVYVKCLNHSLSQIDLLEKLYNERNSG